MRYTEATKRRADRLLVAIYDLANGDPKVDVALNDAYAHAKGLGVFDMTPEQFEAYRLATVARAQEKRKK